MMSDNTKLTEMFTQVMGREPRSQAEFESWGACGAPSHLDEGNRLMIEISGVTDGHDLNIVIDTFIWIVATELADIPNLEPLPRVTGRIAAKLAEYVEEMRERKKKRQAG